MDSITWSWNAVEGATAYVVQQSTDEIFDAGDTVDPRTALTMHTASGLEPETTVYVRVAAAAGSPADQVLSDWTTHVTGMSAMALPPEPPDPFARWNDLPPEPWWRESAPYSCRQEENPDSPWVAAGFPISGVRTLSP